MATGDRQPQLDGDDRELVQLRAAVTQMEQRFDDFTREVRDAIALIGRANHPPPNPLHQHGAGAIPPLPMVDPPVQHQRGALPRHGIANPQPDDSSFEEEADFENPAENYN